MQVHMLWCFADGPSPRMWGYSITQHPHVPAPWLTGVTRGNEPKARLWTSTQPGLKRGGRTGSKGHGECEAETMGSVSELGTEWGQVLAQL